MDAVVAVTIMECSMQSSALLGGVNVLHSAFPEDADLEYSTQSEATPTSPQSILHYSLNISERLILERLDLVGKVRDDPGTETGQHETETSQHGTETGRHGTETGQHGTEPDRYGTESPPPSKRHRSNSSSSSGSLNLSRDLF